MVNVSGGFTGLLAKGAGLTGLGLVTWDAHHFAKEEASKHTKNFKAENLTEHYMNDRKLESPSIVQSKVKEHILNFWADENITSPFTHVAGYVKGFGEMLVQNVVPLGLSVGAVLTKGIVSKGFGIGLAAFGGLYLLREGFGIGKGKE